MGFNGDSISSFTFNAFEEVGQNMDYYIEWYKEINVFEDVCDLEINAVIDNINADFDQIIPTVDGIIYFLNPLKEDEKQFFELILPIINSVKRDIPIVLIYNSEYSFLPISTNKLLEDLWFNHFNLEAFVNLKPKELYQALQCLCFAMITGDSPLNIENAWMRFPIFIQLGNIFYKKAVNENKPELFYYAAQNVRKAAMIADILDKDDYYIISDQAALLFSKTNLYLEASKILADIDKKKAKNFKKLYADSMVLEGNKLFNSRKYDLAAEQYLAAAQWLAIEMNSPELGEEAFRLSINSWISACRVEMAFNVLNSLPHEKALDILNEIADKIISETEFLVKNKNLEAARDQLYRTITLYQREGLFSLLERFTYKLEEILIKILKNHIENKERFAARQAVDEIENLWESYGVKRTNLDKSLDKLVQLFLEDYDFPTSTILINKIESLSLKKSLTKLSSKYEEDFKRIRKDELEENLNKGLEELTLFIDEELRIIDNITNDVILEADKQIEQDNYLDAAEMIESHANFLNKIGREEIQNQIQVKLLDILLIGKQFNKFLTTFEKLPDFLKKEFLNIKFKIITEKIEEYSNEKEFSEISSLFEKIIIFYREQMLYEKSKDISKLFIDYIKKEALTILRTQETVHAVNEALKLVKKASDISSAYLDEEKQNFDQIYQFIVGIYIKLDMLPEANSINEKIENKVLKKEIHKKIAKKESEKSALGIKKIEASIKEDHLKDMYSIIKNRAREASQTRESDLVKRKGLKRIYFEEALTHLGNHDYDSALTAYKNSIERLIKKRDYYLAGVSLSILYLIFMKRNESLKFSDLLNSIRDKLDNLDRFFSETFPVKLVEFIKGVEQFGDPVKLNEAMLLLESLPLFTEEIDLLHSILKGVEVDPSQKAFSEKKSHIKMETLKDNLLEYANRIKKEKQDIGKRKLMKSDYWKLALEDLSNQKYKVSLEEYKEITPLLIDKKFYKFAGLNLAFSTLLTLKTNDIITAKTYLEVKVKDINQLYPEFGNLPEILLTKELINTIEFNNAQLITLGFRHILEKFVLFDEEIEFLTNLLEKITGSEVESQKVLSREEIAQKKALEIRMEQIYGNLSKQVPDRLREKPEKLKKREIMKKRIYKDILAELNQENYEKASYLYFQQAMAMARRLDLDNGALMVLLHGLSLIKAQESFEKIHIDTNEFLESLGANKRSIKDTYYITCILFIFDVISNNLDEFHPKIRYLLDVLPLLDEELDLINLF